MREKAIEKCLTEAVKKVDGLSLKLVSPSMVGIPDRLVLLPNGKLGFVEVKAPQKKPRAIQVKRIKQLEQLGFHCFVLDEVVKIGGIIHAIQSS